MLTDIDINMVWYQQQKHLVNKTDETVDSDFSNTYYVLIKESSYRALAICRHAATAKALSGYDLFAGARTNVRSFTAPLNRVWQYVVGPNGRFVENMEFRDKDALLHALLINQKAYALDHIFHEIYRQSNLYAACDEQALVYNMKYREAKHILDNGIVDDVSCDYPLVSSYADYKQMSLTNAAKLVKLQYDMQSGFMSEVELFRIKFRDMVCAQTDLAGVATAVDRFNHEFFGRKVV